MLFPLKKKDSVVFPGPLRMNQSRITPRHLILNLKRRMRVVWVVRHSTSTDSENNACHNIYLTHYTQRTSSCLLTYGRRADDVKRTRWSIHTYEQSTYYLMKRTENNSLWYTRALFVAVHKYICVPHSDVFSFANQRKCQWMEFTCVLKWSKCCSHNLIINLIIIHI